MRDRYSLYDAKAHFSAIIRQVREGRSVVVTLHGTPVAEIRPVDGPGEGLEARLAELESRGALVPASEAGRLPSRIARKPGALDRFLDDRD